MRIAPSNPFATLAARWLVAAAACLSALANANTPTDAKPAIEDENAPLSDPTTATVEAPAAELENPNANPYLAIAARNAFRLKDPVPPPPPPTNAPPPPEQPKSDVKLAGLATIKGVRYAYLMVPDPDRAGQFLYPTLTDNPTRGQVRHKVGVEIREIDMAKQTVRIVNGGNEATLNFQDNGVKGVPAAPAPTRPGGVPAPGTAPGNRPPLGASASASVTINPGSGAATAGMAGGAQTGEPLIFSRNPNRASGGPAEPVPIDPNSRGLGMTVPFPATVPARPIRTGTVPTTANPTPQMIQHLPQVTPEQQYEILIRQRQAADSQGIQLPPIPGYPMPSDPIPH